MIYTVKRWKFLSVSSWSCWYLAPHLLLNCMKIWISFSPEKLYPKITFFCIYISRSVSRRHCFYVESVLFIYFFLVHLFTRAYIVWVISPPCAPSSPFSPSPTQFQAGTILPLWLILLKKRYKHNKKDKVVLLVKDSCTERFLLLLSCIHVLRLRLIQL
jgi:hypothetical protein